MVQFTNTVKYSTVEFPNISDCSTFFPGTQTCPELDDECLAAFDYVQPTHNHNNNNHNHSNHSSTTRNNHNTHKTNIHATQSTTTSTNFGTQVTFNDTTQAGHGSDGTVEDVITQPVAPFRNDDVVLKRVDVNGDATMSLKTSVGTGTGSRRPMKTQTHFEPKGRTLGLSTMKHPCFCYSGGVFFVFPCEDGV